MKSTDFGFAVNLRQTKLKCDYRKQADKLDAEYHQPGVNRKGKANPAYLPRLGSLLCTRIRAVHLGLRSEQPGPGARLSQLGERVGRCADFNFFYPPSAGKGRS
jgi:hypothetical protein